MHPTNSPVVPWTFPGSTVNCGVVLPLVPLNNNYNLLPGLIGFTGQLQPSGPLPLVVRGAGSNTGPFDPNGIAVPTGTVLMHPGPGDVCAIVRFTAPVSGAYTFNGSFYSAYPNKRTACGNGVVPIVAFSGRNVPSPQNLPATGSGNSSPINASPVTLTTGQTVDFMVAANGADFYCDSTILDLTVTGPDAPPVEPQSTCCPPVTKAIVRGLFHEAGNTASTYTMALDMSSNSVATADSFVAGLNAYLAYVKFLCKETVAFRVQFSQGLVTPPPTLGVPAGPLTTPALIVPFLWNPGTTKAQLNTALNVSWNSMPHNNNQYYRYSVKVEGVNSANQVVNCGFNAEKCFADDTFALSREPTAKMAPGATSGYAD